MKITENELDNTLREKVNQLEDAKKFNGYNYLSVVNNKIVSRSMNPLNLHSIFSMDDIYKFSDHLYKSENNFISAYDTCIVETKNAYATSPLLNNITGELLFSVDSKIIKIKNYDLYLLILDRNGFIYKINKKTLDIENKKNILDILKINFISDHFEVYNIIDIELYNNEVIVATEYNGIFSISLITEESSLKLKELEIKSIKLINNEYLLVSKSSKKNNLVLYNLSLNSKVNIFNHLSKYFQQSDVVDIETDSFYVLGKTYSMNQSDNLLHVWKLDSGKIEYNNIDYIIHANNSDNSYRAKLLTHDTNNIYILGTKNNKIFIWEYNKEYLNDMPTELIFNLQDVLYDDICDFKNINGKFYITLKNKLLVLDNNFNLLENYQLNSNNKFENMFITKNGIYAYYEKYVYVFHVPALIYEKIIQTSFDVEVNCNNVDVFIKAPKDIQLLFLNADTMATITPYFYLKYDNDLHIIKLLKTNATKILLKFGVKETDKIEGIVIHKNRIFYK